MIVTLEEMKQYRLYVTDQKILGIVKQEKKSESTLANVYLKTLAFEESENAKPAVYYAVAYLYEHREEADHHALTLTLRSLLFGSRKEDF